MEEQMNLQPTIGVGMIGHVSNGKSSLTECLTDVKTQKFSEELERNITIHLGYANAKIWKCLKCPKPSCYSSSGSGVMHKNCFVCGDPMKLQIHLSIIDCPGHNKLTSTMMNGSAVMDMTILVESVTNEQIPALQTSEHFTATKMAKIPNKLVVMNKMDICKKQEIVEKITKLQEFVGNVPIIPISASFRANIDVCCEYLAQLKVPERDLDGKLKMIVVRSFDVNRPGCNVTDLKGGVVGGTIVKGCLKVGQRIWIFPGVCTRLKEKDVGCEAEFRYEPLIGLCTSILSDRNNLTIAIPGGLLGIGSTIDPAFTRNDHMTGSLVVGIDGKDDVKVYDKLIVHLTDLLIDRILIKTLLQKNQQIQINANSNNVDCTIFGFSQKTDELKLILSKPIAVEGLDNHITIMGGNNKKNMIIGRAKIIDGILCLK